MLARTPSLSGRIFPNIKNGDAVPLQNSDAFIQRHCLRREIDNGSNLAVRADINVQSLLILVEARNVMGLQFIQQFGPRLRGETVPKGIEPHDDPHFVDVCRDHLLSINSLRTASIIGPPSTPASTNGLALIDVCSRLARRNDERVEEVCDDLGHLYSGRLL